MKKCPYCNVECIHLKKHLKKDHPEEYRRKIDLKSVKAWQNRGFYYGDLKNYIKAIECYQKAILIDPSDADNWFNMAIAYEGLESYQEAIECYEQAVKIDPKYRNAWFNMGIEYEKLKNYNKAIECYEKIVDLDLNDIEALVSIGNVYVNLEDYQKSFEYYEKAIEINPQDNQALSHWGFALLNQAILKKGKEAEKLFDQSLEKFLASEEIKEGSEAYNISCVYSLIGKINESLLWFEKALKMNPLPSREHILSDSDLQNIRKTDEFKKFIDLYRPK